MILLILLKKTFERKLYLMLWWTHLLQEVLIELSMTLWKLPLKPWIVALLFEMLLWTHLLPAFQLIEL